MNKKIRRAARSVQWENAVPMMLIVFAVVYLTGQVVRGFINGTAPIRLTPASISVNISALEVTP